MTLYLKYRPQTLDDLDLRVVRESLKKIVSSGKIPHAFLFSGPKGTGKTSAARILAKIVNCENLLSAGVPCDKCAQCLSIIKGENLDVVEIDAASHRGIDDIRSLKDAVKLAPVRAKKKVYIIDEAHMLTTEASNALLKTLEEPPSHVIFILATTNPEKLIETVRSRAILINFKRASTEEIVDRLEKVAREEGLTLEKETASLIAKASDGSFRDAVKLLEQAISEDKSLKRESIEEFLFHKKAFNVDEFLNILAERQTQKAIKTLEESFSKGISAKGLTQLTLERLRSSLIAKIGLKGEDTEKLSKEDVIQLIKLLSQTLGQIPTVYIEQIPLEIAVVEWCETKSKIPNSPEDKENPKSKTNDNQIKVELEKKDQVATVSNIPVDGFSEEIWVKILSQIKPKNTSTEALLRAAKPLQFDGKVLTLGVYYKFHKERLETNPHRGILEDTVSSVFGNSVRVMCTLTDPPVKKMIDGDTDNQAKNIPSSEITLTDSNDEDIIKVAKEIFGS